MEAIKNGHLEIVKYLHKNGWTFWCYNALQFAAENGHLELLKYLHEIGCPWDE